MHHQGFHVCIDLSTPEPLLSALPKVSNLSPSAVEALKEARAARREQQREINEIRDKKIVEMYANGSGYKDIQKVFGIGQSTTQKVLKKAEAEGLVKIRQRGSNLRWETV